MIAIIEAAPALSVLALCLALGFARATFYRRIKPRLIAPRPSPLRKLSNEERALVLSTLDSQLL